MKNLEQVVNELVKLLQELGPDTHVVMCSGDFDGCQIVEVQGARALVTNDETLVIIE